MPWLKMRLLFYMKAPLLRCFGSDAESTGAPVFYFAYDASVVLYVPHGFPTSVVVSVFLIVFEFHDFS